MQISEEEAELSEWEEVDKGEEEEEEQQSQMRSMPHYDRTTFSKPWKKLVGTLLWSLVRDGSGIQGHFPCCLAWENIACDVEVNLWPDPGQRQDADPEWSVLLRTQAL